MKGFIIDLTEAALANDNFRKVLYTAKNMQLVLMSLAPNEDIGEEVHNLDQFIRIESGQGEALLNGLKYKLEDGMAVIVPAGVKHNIINLGSAPLKLYTLYSPPEHKDSVVRVSKQEALMNEEHFDGQTTE
jgi:mannose-6-phosphate isomerase-like protein (cupin superfamily)